MQREELIELRKSMTVRDLADYYGVSERTMSRKLKEFGITKSTCRLDICDDNVLFDYNSGMSINQIAEKYKCSHDTITKRLAKYGISNTRAEGIRRHFEPTYEERWNDIKADLDRGISVSIVRDKHHIRMENLEKLMDKHHYKKSDDGLYYELLSLIDSVESGEVKVGNVSTYNSYMSLLEGIKTYIDEYRILPDFYALSDIVGRNINVVRRSVKKYGLCQFVRTIRISSWVSFLIRYFQEHDVLYELNNRKILKNFDDNYQEMDFYLPDYHVGIEVNPIGTHSIDVKPIGIVDKDYHQKKSLLAERCGVGLLHMYDADFMDETFFEKVMSMLLTEKTIICGARECSVMQISVKDANDFLQRYHLQGVEHHSKYRYGLYYNNDLCCVMTVGKPRFTNHDFEIIRYCVRPDVAISGGFQKLFSEFKRMCTIGDTVVSYMDLNKRFSVQNIYEKSGFILDGITPPDYVWVNKYGTHTLKRYDTTKKKLVAAGYDANLTEKEIMLSRNYFRLYGAGSKRYVYIVS